MSSDTVTAALIVIGEEILSGRTRDENISHIARYLNDIGIALREVRVVRDIEAEIVAAVNELRARYTYVFTTGGIGPTHDDVTTDAIAKAFGVEVAMDPRAVEAMRQGYSALELTPARLRMARIPQGAELIDNPVSSAPGFMLGNVIVMAGIPRIMQVMLDAVAPRLKKGRPMLSRSGPHRCARGRRGAGARGDPVRAPRRADRLLSVFREGQARHLCGAALRRSERTRPRAWRALGADRQEEVQGL